MGPLRELIDELGGRNLSVLALLCVFVYLASGKYLDSVERRIQGNEAATRENGKTVERLIQQHRGDHLANQQDREQLRYWLTRLDAELKQHEGIGWHQRAGEEISRLLGREQRNGR